MSTKWSDDAFLDRLRQVTDVWADDVLDHETPQDLSNLFGSLIFNHAKPENASERVNEFFERTDGLPIIDGRPLDLERVDRGAKAFWRFAFPTASILVTKSMIEGYAAPNLTKILALAGDLATDTHRRLINTLEMLVNVSAVHAFENGEHGERGEAIITAQKLRLLHAGLRHDVRVLIEAQRTNNFDGLAFHHLKTDVDLTAYPREHQEPLNVEDMLGVVMGLSHLVVEGLAKLDLGMSGEEAEDYYYVWRAFAVKMGIHPPGAPHDDSFVPANLSEAREFYHAFQRRHFVSRDANPDGVLLATAQMKSLNRQFVPRWLRWLGLPESYLRVLVGKRKCAQVGVRTRPWHFLSSVLLYWLPRGWQAMLRTFGGDWNFHQRLGRRVFRGLISDVTGGAEVNFAVPDIVIESDTRDRRKKDRRSRRPAAPTEDERERREGADRRMSRAWRNRAERNAGTLRRESRRPSP